MILKNGLLDKNIEFLVDNVRNKYFKQYNLVFSINDLFLKIINENIFNTFSNDREIYIYTTLFEIHSSFQSIILLLERGLLNNAEIILRSIYEKKFKLFAVIKDKRNYNRILDEREYYAAETALTINNSKNKQFNHLKDKINLNLYNLENYKKKKTSTKKWALYAGLIDEYYKQYSIFSSAVHHDIITLTNLVENKSNGIKINTYSYDNFEDRIKITCEVTLQCLNKVLEYKNINKFNKNIKTILNELKK